MTIATTTTISVEDLQALLDVADGYTSEAGYESIASYADPRQVERAIINAYAAIRKAKS